MFAVPGWNLTAPLKTQTDTPAAPAPNNPTPAAAAPSKKRKRGSNGPAVTGANVADLWAQHIDGVKSSKGDGSKTGKKDKKEKKNKKREVEHNDEQQATAEQVDDDEEVNGLQKDEVSRDLPTNPTKKKSSKANGEEPDRGEDKKKKHKKDKHTNVTENGNTNDQFKGESSELAPLKPSELAKSNNAAPALTPLQASMRAKLSSARFRHLNQTLYTTPSASSLTLFSESPEMFEEYHAGFRQQVAVWPENPVDSYIADLKTRGKAGFKPGKTNTLEPLPRTKGTCVVADFGCGDARLSSSLQPLLHKLHLKIHSFDLHNPSPLVTKADIAALPLANGTVDVGIFCLALMGTNWTDFIDEAFRVLRWKGELWISEIKSRFGRVHGQRKKIVDHSIGKRQKKNKPLTKEEKRRQQEEEETEQNEQLKVVVDENEAKSETDVSAFVEVLRRRGFMLKDAGEGDVNRSRSVDLGNKMFVKMVFVKGTTPTKGKNVPERKEEDVVGKKKGKRFLEEETEEIDEGSVLKPCVYKLR